MVVVVVLLLLLVAIVAMVVVMVAVIVVVVVVAAILVLVVCGVTILWVEGFDHAGSEECIHLSTASPSSSAPRNCPNTSKRRVGRDRSKSGAQEIVNDMSFTLEINQKAGDLVAPCTREIKIGTFLEPGIPKDLGRLPGVWGGCPISGSPCCTLSLHLTQRTAVTSSYGLLESNIPTPIFGKITKHEGATIIEDEMEFADYSVSYCLLFFETPLCFNPQDTTRLI